MKFNRLLVVATCLLIPLMAIGQANRSSTQLMQEYANTHNLRAFALQAKTRPQEGGVFYAQYVISICGRDLAAIERIGAEALAKQVQATGTIPDHVPAMMQIFPRRCAGFVDGEATSLLNELKKAPLSDDPLLSAEHDLRSAYRSRNSDKMRSALRRLMEIDDPILWTHRRLDTLVSQFDAAKTNSLGVYLNGKMYTDDDGIEIMVAGNALTLGLCKPNLPCALDDDVQVYCAGGAYCAADREAWSRNFYFQNGGTEEGWKRTLALAKKVRIAVENKDVGFFLK